MRKTERHFLFFLIFIFAGSLSACTREPVQTDLLVPIDFTNVPENMVLTHFHTNKIEIRVQADPLLIDTLNMENIRYTIDLYTDLEFDPAGDSVSIEPGAYLIPLEKDRVPLASEIRLIGMNPSYISVQLEIKASKTVKVTVPYVGEPAKGYIALEAATEPATVELTGAAPLIQSIDELTTRPIDLSNASESFKKKIPLDLENPSIVPMADPIVTVSVPIQQQLVSRTVEDIPVQVWNATSAVVIEPPVITVSVKGPFETLSNKEILGKIFSFIDLKGLKPGVYARHVYVNIPVDLMMTEAHPTVFTVKIE